MNLLRLPLSRTLECTFRHLLYRTGCHQLKVLHTLQAQPTSRQSECSIASAEGSASLNSRKENSGRTSAVRSNTFPLCLSELPHGEDKENLPQRAPAPYGRFFLYKISVIAICLWCIGLLRKSSLRISAIPFFPESKISIAFKAVIRQFFRLTPLIISFHFICK